MRLCRYWPQSGMAWSVNLAGERKQDVGSNVERKEVDYEICN